MSTPTDSRFSATDETFQLHPTILLHVMGAGASVKGDLAEILSESDCKELTGELFENDVFVQYSNNNSLPKQKLAEIVNSRYDCFLTHDWGKELGLDNHARVAHVNRALQALNLKTWFDQEQMQGDIPTR